MTTSRKVLKSVSTTVATASLMVAIGAKTNIIHADTVNDQTQSQKNTDQLANLAAENTAKEAQMEADNNIANQHDEQQMNQKIQTVNDDFAKQQQALQSQIDAANTAMQQEIKDNSAQVNQQVDAQIKDQQAQNQQAEAKLQQNNQSQLNQAQQEIADAQANVQQTIDHAKEGLTAGQQQNDQNRDQQLQEAQRTFDQQKSQADQQLASGQNQINANIQNAQQALNKANQDVKDHTTTVAASKHAIAITTNALDDQGDGHILGKLTMTPAQMEQIYPKSQWNNQVYRSTQLGLYPNSVVNKNEQNAPSNINEIPTDFKPGLIVYNPNLDHSEVIGKDGLNEHQKQIIANFGVSWANGFRHWIHDNERAVWDYANKNNMFRDLPINDLTYNQTMVDVAKDIEAKRTNKGIDNNHHTLNLTELPSMAKMNEAYKHATNGLNISNDPDHILLMSQGTMENLDTVLPYTNKDGQPTLLGYIVAAYNVAQPMWYGEISNSQAGSIKIGGHTKTVLNNDLTYMSVAMTKCDDPKNGDSKKSLNPSADHPVDYAMTFDGFNYSPIVIEKSAKDKLPYKAIDPSTTRLNDQVQEIRKRFDQVMGSKVVTPEFTAVQNYASQPTGKKITSTPQQYTDAVKNAQNKLNDLNNNKANELKTLNDRHDNTIKQLTADYDSKVNAINAAHDQKAKELETTYQEMVNKAHGKTTSLDNLKKELDQKYQSLVKADQSKIDQLEKSRQEQLAQVKKTAQDKRDNKIKSLNINAAARDNKIKALKENHDKFVQANADKLAQLKSADQKAYNDLKAKIDAEANKNHNVQIGDHTVTLPEDHQKEDHQKEDHQKEDHQKVDDKGTKSNENTQKTEFDDKKANKPDSKEDKTTNPVVKKNSATKDTKVVETTGHHEVTVPTTKVTTENDTANVTATPVDPTTKVEHEATPVATTAKVEHEATPVATTTKVTAENDTTNVTATPVATTTKVEHVTTPAAREETKHVEGKLPQTGNATTQLGVLGLIAGAFGLGLAGRKRRRQDN